MSDFITDFPALLKYWNFDSNIKLDIEKLPITSKKHVSWKCPNCSYEWKASVSKSCRQIQNHTKICPVCDLGEVLVKGENSISDRFPNFLRYINFHYENIETIQNEIENLTFTSKRLFHFKCPTCHVGWKDVANTSRLLTKKLNKKVVHVGCNEYKYCVPHLIKEWSSLNDRQLSYLTNKSSYKAWWNCSVCSNTYQQVVSQKFTSKISCPYCRKAKILKGFNDLPTTHPWLFKEWSTSNDRDFSSLMCNSNYRAWWKCSECSREYRQTVKKKILMNISCCLYCQKNKVLKGFNDLATTHEYLLNEWDYLNNILLAKPTEIDEKSNKIVWWICKDNPNHRYKFKINEKIKYEKRNLITCKICKGLRRKQEHCVQFANL